MQFSKAIRQNVGLLIGLAGGTGSGKTYTAMRLASGIAKAVGKRFAVIDTEAGRAKHYADQFDFDHGDISAPFRPKTYMDAIVEADKAGYPVIVVDSMSHVWSGDGGVLDWQEELLEEMVKRAQDRNDNRPDWQIREASKMRAWIEPKTAHKRMVQRLLQVRAHLILCFRAEEKIDIVKKDGKTVIEAKKGLIGLDGWFPICEKALPFELTASFLLMAQRPGVPLKIKLQEQHKALFQPDREIDEESGRRIAEWAAGGVIAPTTTKTTVKPSTPWTFAAALAEYVKAGGHEDTFKACLKGEGLEKWNDDARAYARSLIAEQRGDVAPAEQEQAA